MSFFDKLTSRPFFSEYVTVLISSHNSFNYNSLHFRSVLYSLVGARVP